MRWEQSYGGSRLVGLGSECDVAGHEVPGRCGSQAAGATRGGQGCELRGSRAGFAVRRAAKGAAVGSQRRGSRAVSECWTV